MRKGFVAESFVVYLGITALLVACASVYFLHEDNAIEEAGERIAERAFNLPEGSIDVTPNSPKE